MRLLLISNPVAYRGTLTDVPMGYQRLAGHPDVELFHADTQAMMSPGDRIQATPIERNFSAAEFAALEGCPSRAYPPDFFDLAFCRTLKPFADGYLDCLKRWSGRITFVNDPSGLSRQLELGFFLAAAGAFAPPSVVTADNARAEDFFGAHGRIVAKRSNSCGGRGVYRISRESDGTFMSENIIEGTRDFARFGDLFGSLTGNGVEELLLMRYLPRVIEGDKRIVVVDGVIYGTYLRTSTAQHWIQNVSAGGVCELLSTDADEQAVVEQTCGPYLEAGIHILGYDLLRADDGDWQVSEINAGNVGGLFRIERLGVAGSTDRFVDWLHSLRARRERPLADCDAP